MIKNTLLLRAVVWMWCFISTVAPQVVITDFGKSVFPKQFMNASGTAVAPVIPVCFQDTSFDEDPVPYLKELFTGSGSVCEGAVIPSVKTYFTAASYGKLTLEGRVQKVVTLSKARAEYSSHPEEMIKESLEYLSSEGVDLSQFDADNNGVLDGLYLVWAGNEEGFYTSWWPNSDTFYFNYSVCGLRIGSYSSLCYTMLKENSSIRRYTAIHETGHQLGLTDYYQNGSTSGSGSNIMMDLSSGDEDCFSKMLLGWITPTIADESGWYTVSSASVFPSAVLIAPDGWDGNMLSEYYMLEYITPEQNQVSQNISERGAVRLWHINAPTSRFTNDISSRMYKYDNSGNGPHLIQVDDVSVPWHEEGELVDRLFLSDGTPTGLSIYIKSFENNEALIYVARNGEIIDIKNLPQKAPDPGSEKTPENTDQSENKDDPHPDAAGSGADTSSEASSEASLESALPTCSDAESVSNEEAAIGEEESFSEEDLSKEEDSEASQSTGGDDPSSVKQLPKALLSGASALAVFVLCFFLLKTPKKPKHSRKKKR